MILLDLFKLWYKNTAIIYNSRFGLLTKTYKELEEDINNCRLTKKNVQLISTNSKYQNLILQLACLKNKKIFCHISNTSNEYKSSLAKNLINIPEHTTHIIASSGTTGTPKLIALNFNETLKTIYNQSEYLNINENSIVSSFLSFTFDASLSDIYGALTQGACLYFTDTPLTKVKSIQQEIINFKITHLDLPPSIIKFLDFSKMEDVKSLIFGGELACENTIKNIAKLGIKCINSYGPTENSISSFMCEVTNDWTANKIGKVICPDYYIDPYLIINNELYISIGLFLGYINNQELTNNKIVTINDMKYFRTGDIVYSKNDELFYIGRIDRQFKRNGVLICPEEVELISRKIGCEYALVTNNDPYTLTYTSNLPKEYIINEIKKYIPENRLPTIFLNEKLKLSKNGKTIS